MAINSSFVRDSVMRISRIKSNLLRDGAVARKPSNKGCAQPYFY